MGANLSLLWVNYHFSLAFVHFIKSTRKSWHGSDPPSPFWVCQDFGSAYPCNPSLYYLNETVQSGKGVGDRQRKENFSKGPRPRKHHPFLTFQKSVLNSSFLSCVDLFSSVYSNILTKTCELDSITVSVIIVVHQAF